MRFSSTLGLDVRQQGRSQLYVVGFGVALAMGLMGRFLIPASWLGRALPIFYLLGIGGTTYMFGASMVLLDKTEGTLDALRVTPLRVEEYLGSKALSLTSFALLESGVVYLVAGGWEAVTPLPLFAGAAVLGSSLTCMGMGQVASHDSVTSFLVPGAVFVSLVVQLPVFYALDIGPSVLWYCTPTQGPMLLMLAGSESLTCLQWVYAVLVSLALMTGSYAYARLRFGDHLHLQRA